MDKQLLPIYILCDLFVSGIKDRDLLKAQQLRRVVSSSLAISCSGSQVQVTIPRREVEVTKPYYFCLGNIYSDIFLFFFLFLFCTRPKYYNRSLSVVLLNYYLLTAVHTGAAGLVALAQWSTIKN